MELMPGSPNNALLKADADPETARKATGDLTGCDNQIADIKSTLKVHSWMLSAVLAFHVGIVWQLHNLSTMVAGLK